jgi:hypothetical protein
MLSILRQKQERFIVDVKGVKEVEIRSTGYIKYFVMVMLSVIANYHKFPPYIIVHYNMILDIP